MPLDKPLPLESTAVKEPKVLFIAFACEPGRGSEPGIGWGFVDEMSRRRPVWVIVDEEFRVATQHYLATKHSQHPIHATFVGLPKLQWIKRWFLGMNIYYYLWQFLAARIGRRLHQEVHFDLVQHVSFERYWMHSAGALIGPPFLFGPVGGGETWPLSMKADMSVRDRLQAYFWTVVRTVMEQDPFLRRTIRKAVAVIPSIPATKSHIERLGGRTLDPMMCLAPKQSATPARDIAQSNGPFRFISIGRLPKWKGAHLGIKAFAKAFGPDSNCNNREAEFVIIGTGSELNHLKSLAKSLGVANQVRFLGDLPYSECLMHLAQANAMIHPILRCSAGLVFESLSLGVPVVCNDIGLSAMVIDSSSGAVIRTVNGPNQVVDDIAATICEWTTNHEHFDLLRKGALERSGQLCREKRGDRLDEIHRQLIGQFAEK
jgi:glycosyltransferase involved in cell wall biosynthesis